jgi:hypothetical protein
MLFTWDTENLCIVFKSWRVTSTMSLLWSLLGVMLLTAGYELIREISRRYEAKIQREIDDMPSKSHLHLPLPPSQTPMPLFVKFNLRILNVQIKVAKMGQTKTTKKKAHCSHQDARPPTHMPKRKLSRLLYTLFKCFIHFSSCKFLPLPSPPTTLAPQNSGFWSFLLCYSGEIEAYEDWNQVAFHDL